MTPKEQNVYNVLNLLVLLFRAKDQQFPNLSEDKKHTLMITKEHLTKANLTLPVFANTLKILDEKGYLYAVSVIEDKYNPELQKFVGDDEHYKKILEEVEKVDTSEAMEKFKTLLGDHIEKKLPAEYVIDKEKIKEQNLTLKDLLDTTREALSGYNDQVVTTIMLYPFRSIETLLEKMNEGQKFDDIHDFELWLHPTKYELHIGNDVISTSYNNKPVLAHYALETLLNYHELSGEKSINYEDVDRFELANVYKDECKKFYDSLNSFFKKYPKLREYFKVHKDKITLNKEI